jgi:phosphoglycolate phosphatase
MQLFFDLDGTLTDPGPGITRCLAHALEQLGRPAPPLGELERFIGPPLKLNFSELLETDDETLIHQGIAHYRDRFGEVGLFENEVYPGIPELLARLGEEGHALRVVTSKPTIYASRIAVHFDLDRHFARVHGSELSGLRADKADLIAHVLDTESLRREDCVMIGDRSHDILGARAHGVRSIGVAWGYGSREELTEAGACGIASDLDELHGLLNRIAEEAT